MAIAHERPNYLAGLNTEQRAAVEHGAVAIKEGPPLLLIAGAGSGKTNTLAYRVAHLIVLGIDPRRILLLTFSRRASVEMQRRVERIVKQVLGLKSGNVSDALAWSGTFHAIGAKLVREYATRIGIEPEFTIHDREDSADQMAFVRQELGFSEKEKRFPRQGTCLSIYSRVVNSEAPLAEVLGRFFPWCIEWEAELKQLFQGYVEAKQKQNVLDYDDLLLYWAQMMGERTLAHEVSSRFDHVLVDEYQDTNRLQASILIGLKPDGRGLTVVGDDAQSIYSFRAATVRNILDFPKQFTPTAHMLTLERNYRSTQPILTAANAVIELAEERFTKNLYSDRLSAERPLLVSVSDDAGQSDYILDKVLQNREAGIPLKAQAVLFRASSHSAGLEIELTRRNIPFVKFGGLKFLEASHIKDVMALLRWVQNARDRVAGFRLLQLLPGIGPTTARRVLDRMAEAKDAFGTLSSFSPPPAAVWHWAQFNDLIRQLTQDPSNWPAELELICRWYEPLLERKYEDAQSRTADLLQLQQIALSYPSRERFLTELTLDPPDATSGEAGPPLLDEEYLILSTIHSAKGQEWTSVFLLNVVDGCIPSDMASGSSAEIEEERRLLYVAMTRAKDQLHLIVPQRFYTSGQRSRGDRHVYASRSRFLPETLLGHFGRATWPAEAGQRRLTDLSRNDQSIDVRSRLRAMWR